jgi:hypothetical protein
MYSRCVFVLSTLALLAVSLMTGPSASAQPRVDAAQDQHQHHQHRQLAVSPLFAPREASGTAWLPDASPMYGVHKQAGEWQLMGHGNVFAQFLYEGGDRGNDQFGSINWAMGMARRTLAGGRFGVRGMFSLEPLTIPGCGYPDSLATGEVCDGGPIHDRQHPHDLFMELAVEYDRPIRGGLRWQLYGGAAGEPALGPAAYPHRLSAMPNPLAPMTHHWFDATHITFGVVTAGVYDSRWKAEGSIFNGREPDEGRTDIDFAPLDSFAGRVWFLPTPQLALQVSAGHLNEAEPAHDGGARIDVDRITASATYHRALPDDGIWASTLAWGRNAESGESTNVLLVETSITLHERDSWFGRFEIGAKPAEDLDVHGADSTFTVAKIQAGYTRYLEAWRGLKPGFGGSVSAGFVPDSLESIYGGRVNSGFGVFVTLRPARHENTR